MNYPLQGLSARIRDWFASIWKRLRARNTGDR